LLYRESNLVIRAIRDLYHPEIAEILIDSPAIYKDAMDFVRLVIPGSAPKVKLYQDEVPLFSRFQIEHQIETAYRREVALPSGGAVVIDKTEALAAIDVNSARATKGADIEQTALNTNLEAADEIARQLRLRDLGGLIVVDFIDMENPRNQRDVENRFRDALKYDRARVQTGKISRFGMMELSRQRLQGSIAEGSHSTCPRCSGTGQIRDVPSSSLHILRLLGEEAMKDNTAMVRAQVPVAVATYLLNEKRAELSAMELRLKVHIILLPTTALETPHFLVERVRPDELGREDLALPSYEMAAALPAEEEEEAPRGGTPAEPKAPRLQPVVKGITPDQPAPLVEAAAAARVVETAKPSFFTRMLGWFKSPAPAEAPTARGSETEVAQRDTQRRRGRPDRDRNEHRSHRTEQAQGRGESTQRTEGQRNERRDRNEQQRRDSGEARRDQRPRGDRQQRPQEGRNDQRGPRPPQTPRAEREPVALESAATQNGEAALTESGEPRRGRGRRGGRRTERSENSASQRSENSTSQRSENVSQRGDNGASPSSETSSPRSEHQPSHRNDHSRGEAQSARAENPPSSRNEPRPANREESEQREHREQPAQSAPPAAFVPSGDRMVTDAVSLPSLFTSAASTNAATTPAANSSPPSPAQRPTELSARAPRLDEAPARAPRPVEVMPAPQLGDLEMVTTRAELAAADASADADSESERRARAARRRPRTQAQGSSELMMVETAGTPAPSTEPAGTESANTEQAHHPRRLRAQRNAGAPSEPLVQIETHGQQE
jgi:ribonuclease E